MASKLEELGQLIQDLTVKGHYKTINGKRVWIEAYWQKKEAAVDKKEIRVQKLIEETGYERKRAETEIERQMKEEGGGPNGGPEGAPDGGPDKKKQVLLEEKEKAAKEKTQAKITTKEQQLQVSLGEFQSLGMKDNLLINILAPIVKLIIKGMATGEITKEDIIAVIVQVKNNKTVKDNKKKEIISKIEKLERDLKGLKSLHDFMIVHDLIHFTEDQTSAELMPGSKTLTPEILSLIQEISLKAEAPLLTGPDGQKVKGVLETGDIPLVAIMSSNVRGGGVFNNELLIQFHQTKKQGAQRTYRYKLKNTEQAREAFMELVNATSAGKWVWENIRGTQKGPAIFPPHKPTIGGTTASLIPYTAGGRSPIKARLGYKGYDELSKELRKFKMSVKEPPTSAEAFTQPELMKFQQKAILRELRKDIPRAQIAGELKKMWEQINMRS